MKQINDEMNVCMMASSQRINLLIVLLFEFDELHWDFHGPLLLEFLHVDFLLRSVLLYQTFG